MSIAELQTYGYIVALVFLSIALYAYIYHLYVKRKDSDGHDYEDYSNMALKDDITDAPVSEKSKKK